MSRQSQASKNLAATRSLRVAKSGGAIRIGAIQVVGYGPAVGDDGAGVFDYGEALVLAVQDVLDPGETYGDGVYGEAFVGYGVFDAPDEGADGAAVFQD